MTTLVLRVVSYNYGDTGQASDLDELAKYAHIIACQEMADRKKEIRGFLLRHPGWIACVGTLPGAPADILLVNVDAIGPVTVIDHPGLGRRYLGPKGNGPLYAKPKPITEYVLQDGTRVFNIHTIPSVTKSVEELGEKEWARRRRHHHDYLARLIGVIVTLPDDADVIVCGDLNSEKSFVLNQPLVDYGFEGWTGVPTRQGRAIDHVLNLKGPDITGNEAVTVSGTHSDHSPVLRTLTTEKADTMPPLLAPPYAGPAKFHGGTNNKPINRLVIHATVSPCEPGMAAKIALYFRKAVTRPSSAHYVIDPDEAFQVVYDSVVAYHAPPNEHSLGFELCFMPTANPDGKWKQDKHHRMVLRAARLVAEACVLYDVPAVRLSVADLKAGKRGICGHNDVSDAWHQTSHWDPGNFPWTGFIRKVVREVDAIKTEQRRHR